MTQSNKYYRLLGHTLHECFVFKDKLQDLLDKQIVELDADIKPVVANVFFINEGNKAQVHTDPHLSSNNEGDDWVIF